MRVFSAIVLVGSLTAYVVEAAQQYRVNEVSRFLNVSNPEVAAEFCNTIIYGSKHNPDALNKRGDGEASGSMQRSPPPFNEHIARGKPHHQQKQQPQVGCVPGEDSPLSLASQYPATQIHSACMQYMFPTGPQRPSAWVMPTGSASESEMSPTGTSYRHSASSSVKESNATKASRPDPSWTSNPSATGTSAGHEPTTSPIVSSNSLMYSSTTSSSSASGALFPTNCSICNSSTTISSTTSFNASLTTSLTTSLPTNASTTLTTTTSTSSAPTCDPTFVLNGVSESAFNAVNVPFTLDVQCGSLDVNNYTMFANFEIIEGIEASASQISVPGFADAEVFLTVLALDLNGNVFQGAYQLIFGDISMPVLVLDANDNPVVGARVTANATTFPYVGQVVTTDGSGVGVFTNVPQTTIGLVATTLDNQIAVNGLAATSSSTTLTLIPFTIPGNVTSDFDNGTIGWTGGVEVDGSSVTRRSLTPRDTSDLEVSTDGQFDEQLASKEFQLYPFTKTTYIKYKFITAEVPGGYFGSQYNDYFSVTVRDDTGAYSTYTNSMNALGLGAFDADGATDWMQLQLQVSSKAQYVHFDVGVSNVVDNLLDSEIIVDHVGDLTCDQCGDCSVCAGDPMCQNQCLSPPPQSCNWYRDCAAASMQTLCPDGGYPINYGWKNCNNFQNQLNQLSAAGQTWMWGVMNCLQNALLPQLPPQDCGATCQSVSDAAFASHPKCYVDNGFCDLPLSDYWAVFNIVGIKQLLQVPMQVIITGAMCGEQWADETVQAVENEIATLAANAVSAAADAALDAAKEIGYQLFLNILNPGPQV